MPAPGDRVCGHIRLMRYGAEGMGSPVFGPTLAAQDEDSGLDLHLTIIGKAFVPGSIAISGFMAGANALTSLRHPGLVRAALVDREETYAMVGYESLPGGKSLRSIQGKRVSGPTVARRAMEIARALDFLHERDVIHGLLSMSTVLVWEQSAMIWQYGLISLCDPAALASSIKRLSGSHLSTSGAGRRSSPSSHRDSTRWRPWRASSKAIERRFRWARMGSTCSRVASLAVSESGPSSRASC
jgi:hypothetical protein